MAVVVAGSRARAEQARLQWREQEPRSPEMAAPPRPPRLRPARAAVVYYLARNRHLEHPHFMEVALSCPDGLYLRDVIDRLDALRGKGMARMYSWASKRSYRNGFVWHDLADDDYIHPVVGREYVLKGTERLHPVPPALLDAAAASSSSSGSHETPTSSSSARCEAHGRPAHRMKSSSACGAADLGEYVVYKGEERAADAATQTEDSRSHQRRLLAPAAQEELSRAETSPPTASTSPETLEALIKADGRVVAAVSGSGRARASSVLMQLISCGSVSVRDARASPVMPPAHHHNHHHRGRARPPRPPATAAVELPSYRAKILEDKEYFSGSIIETAKRSPANHVTSQDLAVLRRSSSYNAERVIKLELAKEAGDLHDRCIPRKPKGKKDGYLVISCSAQGNNKG
ncbi:protein SOSEKI 5-like [Miscanthus floridulus]|uniref:protein SOSEKI 5-like n=1 Tax=Miscanthus floridulus TaxID=154761 RepID=UPI003459B903